MRRISSCELLCRYAAIFVTAIVIVGVGAGVSTVRGQSSAGTVRVNLGWTDLGYFDPFFVAQHNNYYEKQGLSVKLTYGSGAAQALSQVGTGLFDVTVADTIVGLKAVSSGVPVTMVGTYGPSSIIAYVSLGGYGIRKPKDLEGKILGGPPSDTGIVLLPAFAKFAGFDASKVKVLNVDSATRIPALFLHKIDFLVSFDGGSVQVVETQARKQGRTPVALFWRDYGFNALGLSLWVNNDFLKKNPDLVERFLKGTYQGVQFMIQNPDIAADIYSIVAPVLDKEVTRRAVRSFARTFEEDTQIKNGLGFIDPKSLATTYDIATKFADVRSLGDLKSVYTNRFVVVAPIFPHGK